MNKQRLMIHIGVPKSATTSLQFGAFSQHPAICYLGKPFYDEQFGYEGSLATAELIDSLWKQDSLEFDDDLARQRFGAGIRPRLAADKLAVLSEEGLSHAGATDRGLIAERLAELCKDVDCCILLTVREQKQALFSMHQWYYVRIMLSHKFEDWIHWCRSYSTYYGRQNDFPLREYSYTKLVETYIELFGKERVLVLPMEMLAKKPVEFFSRLEDFAGISHYWSTPEYSGMMIENRSPGRLGIRYQRMIKGARQLYAHLRGESVTLSEAIEDTGIHGHIMSLISRVDSPMPPMSVETAAWIDDYYRADNEALRDLTGLDLSDYGYRL
ncbi:MAG: hypothetical protein P1U35_08520 [Cycloclasticus sp.]|nr:hypothetical protein [Cycloclasticus sp.]